MAVAVMLKERNREMCGLQSIIALLLYKSHIPKKVYERLNHLGVTISYNAVLELVEEISKRNMAALARWKAEGYLIKFVGDNVNLSIKVREVRLDHKDQMINMYIVMAIHNRVPISTVNTTTTSDLSAVPTTSFLPSYNDVLSLKANLTIIVSRILCENIKELSCASKLVPKHIYNENSKYMSTKSEVVVLDILHKNETSHADMLSIMKTQQDYLGESDITVLSGGDQLTCERQRGAKSHVMDGDTRRDRLDLLEPVVEDWHTLQSFLGVIWKLLFKSSRRDHGTLWYFCSLLGRLPRANKPKKDFHACSDALFTIFKGHVIAAACKEMGLSVPDGVLADKLTGKSNADKRAYVIAIARKVVDKYTIITDAVLNRPIPETKDGIYNYTRQFCHLAALAMEFVDSWREGDADRILRCWKILLLHFRTTSRTKYALEALTLQFQLKTLSPDLVSMLKWGRFVNTHSGYGRNIPCDLYCEHMVRLFKETVRNMGSNFSEHASSTVARSLTVLQNIASKFDSESNIHPDSTVHSELSNAGDIKVVVSTVLRNNLLGVQVGRKHSSFPGISANPLKNLDWKKMDTWIRQKSTQYMKRVPIHEENEYLSDSDSDDNDT